jgi:hypothetical protein
MLANEASDVKVVSARWKYAGRLGLGVHDIGKIEIVDRGVNQAHQGVGRFG